MGELEIPTWALTMIGLLTAAVFVIACGLVFGALRWGMRMAWYGSQALQKIDEGTVELKGIRAELSGHDHRITSLEDWRVQTEGCDG